MKAPNPFVIKSVTAVVAAGVLVPSCTDGYNFDDSYYGTHAENLPNSRSLFDINESNLSEEFLHKLQTIHQIINTIMANKKDARRFAKNPDEYIAENEMHFNVVLHEAERKLLLAFADDDILNAVETKDIETFLN